MLPKKLIGKTVDITWANPDYDWPRFSVVEQDGEWVRMIGRSYDGDTHDGSVFWVRECDIGQIAEVLEPTENV